MGTYITAVIYAIISTNEPAYTNTVEHTQCRPYMCAY